MTRERLPLFPLRAVLFPGSRLQLRIFERRYVDLIRSCMRDGRGFGIPPIQHGNEAGVPATPWPGGTLAVIRDFSQGADGLLHIEVEGERRFRLHGQQVGADGVLIGEVSWLDATDEANAGVEDSDLREVLALLDPELAESGALPTLAGDQLVYRLLERLPVPVELQVEILLSDSVERQQALCRDLLAKLLAMPPRETH